MKLKSLILTIGLSLFALSGLLAQEKYEYAMVKGNSAQITCVTGEKVDISPTNPKEYEIDLLKKINEWGDKGWEVYNTTQDPTGSGKTYYLRKKKNQ